MFCYKIREIFKNIFFYGTPPVVASENNEQQQLSEANIYNKIVSSVLLRKLIDDFPVCKHCIRTLLLATSSHDFEN